MDDSEAEFDFSDARRGFYAGRFYVEPGTPVGTTVVLRKPFTGREQAVRLTVRPGDIRLPAAAEILHVRKTG